MTASYIFPLSWFSSTDGKYVIHANYVISSGSHISHLNLMFFLDTGKRVHVFTGEKIIASPDGIHFAQISSEDKRIVHIGTCLPDQHVMVS